MADQPTLHSGGVASGRICVCGLRTRLVLIDRPIIPLFIIISPSIYINESLIELFVDWGLLFLLIPSYTSQLIAYNLHAWFSFLKAFH